MTEFRRVSDYRFEIGQLISHRRYGYRGVVFGRDPACTAEEDWYLSNQTQPDRNQPWYHVMVHGAAHTTYVAESNLEPDHSGEPVDHPWIDRFFTSFTGEGYSQQSLN